MNRIIIILKMIYYYIKNIYSKFIYFILKMDYSDTWLISERGTEARDNGYAFYNYLKKNHKELNIKYVITKESSDINKIHKNDRVMYRSLEHYMIYNKAKYLLSTHIGGCTPNMLIFPILERHQMIKVKGFIIDLKHGITKDFLSNLNSEKNRMDLLISGAKPEYEYMIKAFNYGKSIIKYTGFARYDSLYNADCKEKIILIMPTWRTYLQGNSKEFLESKYYFMWNNLLNSPELKKIIEKENLKIIFYPHYEMQKYLQFFKTEDYNNIIIANKKKYDIQDLLRKSKMLITDYSSVFFDFAYLEKPIIFYHFDYEEYRNTQYKEGYFDYEKDGFGTVGKTEKDVINEIKKILNNSLKMEDKYIEKKRNFFTYNDNNNCKRIYQEIVKLEKKE